MAEAQPDDPVARAKAIALKLTATTAPPTEGVTAEAIQMPAVQTYPGQGTVPAPSNVPLPAPAPASESGKSSKSINRVVFFDVIVSLRSIQLMGP